MQPTLPFDCEPAPIRPLSKTRTIGERSKADERNADQSPEPRNPGDAIAPRGGRRRAAPAGPLEREALRARLAPAALAATVTGVEPKTPSAPPAAFAPVVPSAPLAPVGRFASVAPRGPATPAARAAPRCLAPPATPVPGAHLLVRHPRARRYVISVREDGTVRVTIPRWGSRREALEFAAAQGDWIERQRRRLAERRARRCADSLPPEFEQAVRERAHRELPARLLELAAEHGFEVARVSVRNQKWRWGSCSRRGHICLNWRLVLMPEWVRDYVMIHELMHLRRLDHSARFWKLVERVCPDYRRAREWLRVSCRLPYL